MFKKIIQSLLNESTISGRIFNLFIIVLIIISVFSFSIETIPNLDKKYFDLIQVSEIVIIIIFTLEYLIRIFYSEKSFRYIFSFYGIVDLLAILPFYLSTGIDLRSIRIIRALRIFRILKLVRYSRAIQRYKNAFISIKSELSVFLVAASFMLYISAVGIYYFENEVQPDKFSSVFDALWWSLITLTTVGYGDVFPITIGGKIFTAIIVIVGLGFVAVPTGLVASALTKAIQDENK